MTAFLAEHVTSPNAINQFLTSHTYRPWLLRNKSIETATVNAIYAGKKPDVDDTYAALACTTPQLASHIAAVDKRPSVVEQYLSMSSDVETVVGLIQADKTLQRSATLRNHLIDTYPDKIPVALTDTWAMQPRFFPAGVWCAQLPGSTLPTATYQRICEQASTTAKKWDLRDHLMPALEQDIGILDWLITSGPPQLLLQAASATHLDADRVETLTARILDTATTIDDVRYCVMALLFNPCIPDQSPQRIIDMVNASTLPVVKVCSQTLDWQHSVQSTQSTRERARSSNVQLLGWVARRLSKPRLHQTLHMLTHTQFDGHDENQVELLCQVALAAWEHMRDSFIPDPHGHIQQLFILLHELLSGAGLVSSEFHERLRTYAEDGCAAARREDQAIHSSRAVDRPRQYSEQVIEELCREVAASEPIRRLYAQPFAVREGLAHWLTTELDDDPALWALVEPVDETLPANGPDSTLAGLVNRIKTVMM